MHLLKTLVKTYCRRMLISTVSVFEGDGQGMLLAARRLAGERYLVGYSAGSYLQACCK
ncbi:MAG: hypothetical protein IPJ13_08395 [Saprospiraceae bacterium]|nr:hypothetical protein [Saprospiraceae bacterium]